MSNPLDSWLGWIAAYGLPGSMHEPPTAPLLPAEWDELLSTVRRHQLVGLLWQAIEDGKLSVDEQRRDQVARTHIDAMAGAVLLEAELLFVVRELRTQGVETRVLKGSAVAHLDYPNPALRPFGDVDLLVRSEDIDAAVHILTGLGYPRSFSEPRRGFDRRYGKGASFRNERGYELDLHRTFVMGPFGLRIPLSSLWQDKRTFAVGGETLDALGDDERFLNACYSAAISDPLPRRATQRDIAQMLLYGQVHRRRVRELAASWQAEALVARAVRDTWQALQLADVTALSSWAIRYRPAPHELRDVALYTTPGVSYTAQSLAAVSAIRGVGPKARFVLSLGVPRREFAAPTHRGFTARLWKGARDLADARARQ